MLLLNIMAIRINPNDGKPYCGIGMIKNQLCIKL
jgi:hypothetical protein